MAIAMVAMLAFGGTYAYFTAEVSGVIAGEEITTGHVAIAMGTKNTITKKTLETLAVPGDTLWTVDLSLDTSASNVKTYVFASWTLTNDEGLVLNTTIAEGSDWAAVEGETNVYYIAVDANTAKDTITFTGSVVLDAEDNGNDKMDVSASCSVAFATTQANHLTPAAAYALVK